MDDEDLLRYSRHILLDEIGIAGQERISSARILQIGVGGLGSSCALYLASAGVGRLHLVDDDTVELSNLQRQIIHPYAHLGHNKAQSAKRSIALSRSKTEVIAHALRADAAFLNALLENIDIVVDCSDNFATRHAVNAACTAHQKPLVSASALRFAGQIAVYDTRLAAAPCYACVFPEHSAPPETACATMGVYAPLVGIMGSMQAAEALKLCLGDPDIAPISAGSAGKLLMLDALRMEWTEIRTQRNPDCVVCSAR